MRHTAPRRPPRSPSRRTNAATAQGSPVSHKLQCRLNCSQRAPAGWVSKLPGTAPASVLVLRLGHGPAACHWRTRGGACSCRALAEHPPPPHSAAGRHRPLKPLCEVPYQSADVSSRSPCPSPAPSPPLCPLHHWALGRPQGCTAPRPPVGRSGAEDAEGGGAGVGEAQRRCGLGVSRLMCASWTNPERVSENSCWPKAASARRRRPAVRTAHAPDRSSSACPPLPPLFAPGPRAAAPRPPRWRATTKSLAEGPHSHSHSPLFPSPPRPFAAGPHACPCP